jgi:ectoine hydrolase
MYVAPMSTAERRSAFVNWPILYEGMDAAGLDAIVAFSPSGTHYLSGCYNEEETFLGDRMSMVVVPREGEPTYIVCKGDEPLARSDAWLADIRTYLVHVTSPIEALVTVLAERGLEHSRLGLETGFLAIAHHRELAERLPKAALLEGDSVLARTRWLKMPSEIERMQHAVVAGDQAVYAAWKRCHAGDTEKQVQAKMIEEMGRRGADKFMIFLASGSDVALTHKSASDRRLTRGDLVTCVFVCFWGGYWSDNERMGSVGPPTAQQRDQYKVAYDILNGTIELIKPGVEVGELYKYPVSAVRRHGDTNLRTRAHAGHGMPRTMGHEDPQIQPHVRTLLEPNMLFMLEQSYFVGPSRFTVSHFVQVTETGHRVLDDWWNFQEMFVFE